jgi:hypothetical protein
MASLPLSKIGSLIGPKPTMPSADYAQLLKTLYFSLEIRLSIAPPGFKAVH